jgi:hypothetical protein|tara:strand:+ start:1751 stop:2047 length:297 start_codon:yes stop_codon:yes gene_type:complete
MVYTPNETDGNQFDRLGHPGSISATTLVTDDNLVAFTGSNYGYGAVMVTGSYSGTISLSGGGTIDGNTLSTGTLYEFSVSEVGGGTAPDGIYVFKRQA